MRLPIYLDYNATTPVAPEVADAIEPFLREQFGNPSSSHRYGRQANEAVDKARAQVAALIGANPSEILFTGCATEANNLAILGVARALRDTRRHIITSAIEHPAVTQPYLRLKEDGWDVTVVPVDGAARIDPNAVSRALRADTAFVSIMHANNEVGTLQDIAAIAKMAHARGALMHTDAAQSIGKIPVDVDALGVDLLTIAGHKFYAPKGVGALYVRRCTPICPVIVGADHERGLRPGTENVPAIVGLGEAARLARERADVLRAHLREMRDLLHRLLAEGVPGLTLNGHAENRLPTTLNVSFPGVSGRELLQAVEADVAASLGSACHDETATVSGVLAAMGVTIDRALGAVRLSVGMPTTDEEVRHAASALAGAWRGLRKASSASQTSR
ncbi:MAG: cysteine desulfurase [Betaproteobacteria bacterium]|nr:cysteine desulfurase [Betaproteobacteria bacterium]